MISYKKSKTMNKLNSSIRDYLKSKRVNNPINITLTQLQNVNGFNVDDRLSEQNFKHFRNVLNTKIFGNSYRRFNKQLQMLVVREVSVRERHHLHCIIEQPNKLNFDEFSELIKEVWFSTSFGDTQIHIEKPSSQNREDGWFHYIMKDRTKISFEDSIDWLNSTVLNQ
jgi:hypothetical protein